MTPSLTLACHAHRNAARACRAAMMVCTSFSMPPGHGKDPVLVAIDLAAIRCGDAGGPHRDLWTALDYAEEGQYDRAVFFLSRQAEYHETRAAHYDSAS